MRLTSPLDGQVLFALLAGTALAYPLSRVLLWRYVKAVERLMRTTSDVDARLKPPASARVQLGRASARLAEVPEARRRRATEAGETPVRMTLDTNGLARTMKQMPWRAGLVEGIGGLAYALYHGWLHLAADQITISPYRMLMLTLVYAWPTIIAVFLVAGISRRDRIAILASGAALFLAAMWWTYVGPAGEAVVQGALLYVITNGLPTLLLLAFMTPRVRAVGPMVLLVCLLTVGGSVVFVTVVGSSDAYMRLAVKIGAALGLGGSGTFVLINLAGAAVAIVLGWWLLRFLAGQYAVGRLGDNDFVLGSLWLVFALVHSIDLARSGLLWFGLGLTSFPLYLLVTRIARRWLLSPHAGTPAPSLLLLRVFARGGPTTTLFRQVGRHWRHIGPIRMIAGYDLAETAIEPNEFMAFLGGKVTQSFIGGSDDADARLALSDLERDPDGRYRVEEYFCHDDTWRSTLAGLVGHSTAVLMDLRGLSRHNEGCLFEVDRLIDTRAIDHTVLVVDRQTDLSLLKARVAGAGFPEANLPLLEWSGREHDDLDHLIDRLAGAAA